jgi:predicted nucleotidyltransferase
MNELVFALVYSGPPAPESVEAPSLTLLGPSGPGSTLVTDGGSWANVEGGEVTADPDNADLSYSWSRCDWAGANCQVIENADDPSYDLTEDDVDHRLRATASVLTYGGSAAATSEPTDAIGDSDASAEGDIAYVDTSGELQLTPEDAEDGGEVGRRLAVEAPNAQVVLFGSHARGSATSRSDIDVLVIEPEVENTALESVRLMRAVGDLRLPVEIVVVSEREAAEWRDVRGSLVHAALSEGRVLAA